MGTYEEALRGLNQAQKQAVTTTDGPVLVIAGPGTGKTQLLGVRVAHILHETDTLPQNILCLTFTENGAENMRERLTRFIGKEAFGVNISTYHAFGGDLIRRFPEAFAETRLQSPVDELTRRQILRTIVDSLSYYNPLKQLHHHLGDLVGTISEVKRALLDAHALRKVAEENATFIAAANQETKAIFEHTLSLTGGLAKVLPLFEQLLARIRQHIPASPVHQQFGSLGHIADEELAAAIRQATNSGKTTPLTAWKNTWLAKDADNHFIFNGALQNDRIKALADVFEQYQAALETHGWYDFDDMIIRAIQALEKNADLRYSLQEQYLYLMLDEFQDTNAAQLRLVQLLSDNPVHEGRPNVLAVGDDDQAIYAFQGAQYSNMLDFYRMYRDVAVIHLTENYRSTADILTAAHNVSRQISGRLTHHFEGMSKELRAVNTQLPERADLERREFYSDVAQYDWIATRVQQLIADGTQPSEIAVLAPKHRQLEPLVPYLAEREIPMRYEKRENILEAPVIRQLIAMSKLVLALHAQDEATADALWPEVLSFDFWSIPTSAIWQVSWRVTDAASEENLTWSRALLESDQAVLKSPVLLMLGLAGHVTTETCEQLLDYMIGTTALPTHEADLPIVRSPLRDYYMGQPVQRTNPELFYDTISHLTVLRARLREFETAQDNALTLQNLIDFVDMYEAAEERLLNTSPYNQQADAVQLMTVFKAKGLEFAHVFLPSCQDDVWGGSSHSNSNKLTLPANLAPIRHAGATDDERLRILYVAMTRAKQGLHLTSFTRTYTGKTTKRLQYLDEQEQPDGSFISLILPPHAQAVVPSDHTAPTLDSLELHWRKRHTDALGAVDLHGLLAARLTKYQLSPTHLTCFIDLEYGGPELFFFRTLLRFPEAPTVHSMFGNAVHETLEWIQHQTTAQGSVPPIPKILHYFTLRLQKCKLTPEQYALEHERGEQALTAYLAARSHIFTPTDKAEHNFKHEGVFVGEAHLSGKVDRMEIDPVRKVITVVDYKTGKSHSRWTSEMRLHKYQLQLYCYKLLIEGSRTFKGYTVEQGRLEFIEPDAENRINFLPLTFQDAELARTRKLLQAMWQHVHALHFPDIENYDTSPTGTRQFESDLIQAEE